MTVPKFIAASQPDNKLFELIEHFYRAIFILCGYIKFCVFTQFPDDSYDNGFLPLE